MEKRSALKIWTVLLAILTFSLSLLGTFLVRSGVLTSVHAFATDPTRGVFILGILILFIGGSLALFAVRAGTLESGGLFAPISREGALVFNNLFLTTACATVLTGTLYPLVLEVVTGEKISVGAPFFDLTFGPLMVPLLMAVPFGPLLAWKRGDLYAAAQRLYFAFGLALVAVVGTIALTSGTRILAALGFGLAVWLLAGSVVDLAGRAGLPKVSPAIALRRLFGLPRSAFGTALAHAGLGLTVLGVITTSAFQTELVTTMRPGEMRDAGGYQVRFDGMNPRQGSNYSEEVAGFTLMRGGVVQTLMESSKRFYPARQMPTTEAGIHTHGLSQLYIAIGDTSPDGAVVVRLWGKPLITLIWLGAVAMAAGGMISLADRRLRVGAPARSRRRAGMPSETAVA